MTTDEMKREAAYLMTMNIAKKWVQDGLLSKEKYCDFDTKMREKYAPKFGVLFSEIDLTNSEK